MKPRLLEKMVCNWGHLPLHILFSTCRFKELGVENLYKTSKESSGSVIMSWHSHLLIPFYYLRKYPIIPLIGLHSDAEILSRIGKRLGYTPLRGSSKRKPIAAATELLRTLKQPKNLVALTPDGPRGPEKKVKIGTLKIIQKAGASIIPLGASASRNRVFNSWDNFHQPKAFSKIVVVFGEPIKLQKNESCNLELLADQVSEKINYVQNLSEYEVKH